MGIKELGDYIKNNFGLIIAMTIVLTPSIWTIASNYYSDRITFMKEQIDQLKKSNEETKSKSDGYKELLVKESVIDWSTIKSN